jgi:hypothetical protein
MSEIVRCDACRRETETGARRGWLSIRYFRDDLWDDHDPDDCGIPGADYDACTVDCAKRILDIAAIEVTDGS